MTTTTPQSEYEKTMMKIFRIALKKTGNYFIKKKNVTKTLIPAHFAIALQKGFYSENVLICFGACDLKDASEEADTYQ